MKKKLILLFLLINCLCFAQRFGNNKIQAKKIKWKAMSTMHFNIYFANQDTNFAKVAALIAEKSYYYLKQAFKLPIKNRIPIIVYSSQRGFATTNIIYPLLTEGVGGFTELSKNRVVMPFTGSYLKFEEVLIHELTHAYVNAINSGGVSGSRFSGGNRLPFWFNEGLPEYLSIGGTNVYNNMFVLDAVINAQVPKLQYIGGYYAYRFGEAFLTWIGKKYSKQKVIDFFHAVRFNSDLQKASKKVFNLSFDELQKHWKIALKRQYSNYINNYYAPWEKYKQLTKRKKYQGSANTSARISPDGEKFVYFSKQELRTAIKMGKLNDDKYNKVVLVGEKDARFEEFHFNRSSIVWINNSTVAFVAKTYSHDNIYFLNVNTKKIIKTIQLKQFKAVFKIDFNKQTNKIVFSAQKKHGDDIYTLNLTTNKITAITNDDYHDYSPRFSFDGSKIVFSSERQVSTPDTNHVFYGLKSYIYMYDINKKSFKQLSFGNYHSYNPQFNLDDNIVLYLSEENKVTNYKALNLKTNKSAFLNQTLCGVLDGDFKQTTIIDSTAKNIIIKKPALILSIFYNGGWDIYLQQSPLDSLSWKNAKTPVDVNFSKDDFKTKFNTDRWKLYGKRNLKFKKIKNKNLLFNGKKTFKKFNEFKLSKADSLKLKFNKSVDKQPTTVKIPKISDYTNKFSLDRIWGGMAYSSSVGAVGFLELRMSDLLGNKAIGLQTSLSGDLQRSNFLLNYLFLENKTDYALGAFHINDTDVYDIVYKNGLSETIQERERFFGASLTTIFPLSKYLRLEFNNALYAERDYYELWKKDKEKWKTGQELSYFVYQPSFSIVHDNSLNSSVGPISGFKARFDIQKAFEMNKKKEIIEKYNRPVLDALSKDAGKDFLTTTIDLRYYKLFAGRFALATRLKLASSFGKNPQQFYLDEYNGFRGQDGNIHGKNKALATIELRYPFLDMLSIPFPLPLQFSNVRGAMFVDAATAFDDKFELKQEGRLKDLKLSFGFGPRMNAAIFIIKLDITWTSDLINHGSPTYYFTLWQEF